ncbi:MAG: DNA cytosine methyltransferase [Desulfovibrio sp.]
MMGFSYLSVCSGIEAISVAWELLQFKPLAFSEIEKNPCGVLRHHWPDVPNLGDMQNITQDDFSQRVDVLVGGTPCQAFSFAGKRKSLEDDRGNLSLKFIELANALQPSAILWENVPGVFSTSDNAFGCFLSGIVGEDMPLKPTGGKWTNAGYVSGPERAAAWRVFDAQYFGIPQRRKRVFVVAAPRDGFDPAEVLFEYEGMRRDFAPRGPEETSITGTLTACSFTGDGAGLNNHIAGTITSSAFIGGAGGRPEGAAVNHFLPVCALTGTGAGVTGPDDNQAQAGHLIPVKTFIRQSTFEYKEGAVAGAVCARNYKAATDLVCDEANSVRKLMPIECERLQGFPDDFTRYGKREDGTEYELSDTARYKAVGNSMAVPVVKWIGQRLESALSKK